jgi:hypothetical protein
VLVLWSRAASTFESRMPSTDKSIKSVGYPRISKLRQQLLPPTGGSSEAIMYLCGSGSCLSARGSSGVATCPCGSDFRLPAQAVTCHLRSSNHLLAHGSSEAVMCLEDGLCRLQAIKQISPDDPAIMIFIGTRAHVSSKALRDKGCSARSQDMQQATH